MGLVFCFDIRNGLRAISLLDQFGTMDGVLFGFFLDVVLRSQSRDRMNWHAGKAIKIAFLNQHFTSTHACYKVCTTLLLSFSSLS